MLTNDLRLDTAIHEAGHAIVAYHSGVNIHYSSIRQTGHMSGHILYKPKLFRRRVIDQISIAGYAACILYDIKHYQQTKERIQTHQLTSAEDWALIKGNISDALDIAYEVLEKHWRQVEIIATELLNSPTGSLSGQQIASILS